MTLLDNYSTRHPLGHRDGKVRCVCVDSEPKVIGHISRSDNRHGQLFRDENMIVGQAGRGNNFALGYYGNGDITQETSLLNRTMDAVRKEVERCDYFAGIPSISYKNMTMLLLFDYLIALVLHKFTDLYR